MKPLTIKISAMRDLPVGMRARLRELTIGPVAWGLWSLTHHDGSTWVAIGFAGDSQDPKNALGWACVTAEYDVLPMLGIYVSEAYRRRGIGAQLGGALLSSLLQSGHINAGSEVYVSLWRWPNYEKLLESLGLRCVEWT